MFPIAVRYNPLFGSVFLAGAVIVAGTSLVTGNGMLLVVGLLNAGVAIGFLVQPWFVVHADRIGVRNLLGMTMKQHAIAKPSDLTVADKVFLSGQAIGGGFLARSTDLELLRRAIAAEAEAAAARSAQHASA